MTPDTPKTAMMTAESSITNTTATPARNPGGAPAGNRNAIRSGLRSFPIGRFPPGCSYVPRQAHLLRRQLREAVTTQDGQTTVWSESVIASACQHEARRLLLLRWLRLEGDKLSVLDRATLLDKIGGATDSRDRCLKLLRLDMAQKTVDPWGDALTLPPPASPTIVPMHAQADVPAQKASTGLPDASDAILEKTSDFASTSQIHTEGVSRAT